MSSFVEFYHVHKAILCEYDNIISAISKLSSSEESISDELMNSVRNDFHLFMMLLKGHSQGEVDVLWPALASQLSAKENANYDQHLNEVVEKIEVFLNSTDAEVRKTVLLELKKLMATSRQEIGDHFAEEEAYVFPLFQRHFTNEDMTQLLGQIMGQRGSEFIEILLQILERNLTAAEKSHVIDSFCNATKDTFFKNWLSSATTNPSSKFILSQFAKSSKGSKRKQVVEDSFSAPTDNEKIAFAVEIVKSSTMSEEEKATVLNALQNIRTGTDVQSTPPTGEDTSRSSSDGSDEISSPLKTRKLSDSITSQSNETKSEQKLPLGNQTYGCAHYSRGCKLVSPCCGKIYSCRHCHDEAEDHSLDRYAISSVICCACELQQPSDSPTCINPQCQLRFSSYFCRICHFYFAGDGPVYHCPYCNICRRGIGLGVDYHHCMKCNACINPQLLPQHQCLAHSIERICPICMTYLFNSTEKLKGLRCGHVLHLDCFRAHKKQSSSCPLCRASIEEE